jgi:hypothetical protein
LGVGLEVAFGVVVGSAVSVGDEMAVSAELADGLVAGVAVAPATLDSGVAVGDAPVAEQAATTNAIPTPSAARRHSLGRAIEIVMLPSVAFVALGAAEATTPAGILKPRPAADATAPQMA